MFKREKILFKGKTGLSSYQVVDMFYEGRRARVLFSGERDAAFSGMPLDGESDLLFDYIQRLFELAANTRPRKLLMIGGGTYTLPMALINALPDIQIDVVEIDEGLDKLAEQFFGYTGDSRIQIFHEDGRKYLERTTKKYDMVMVDAFQQLKIPENLGDKATARLIHKSLSSRGIFAMNMITPYLGREADSFKQLRNLYEKIYQNTLTYPADTSFSLWMSQNFIFLAEKGKPRQTHGMRFEPVQISQAT